MINPKIKPTKKPLPQKKFGYVVPIGTKGNKKGKSGANALLGERSFGWEVYCVSCKKHIRYGVPLKKLANKCIQCGNILSQ